MRSWQKNIYIRSGPVVMLNLLRFRAYADNAETPALAPLIAISGKEAYQLYIKHTLPHLLKSGDEILFSGTGGIFLAGPENEKWDEVMLIKQNIVNDFMAFASNQEYLMGVGYRTAALEDSRLLLLVESSFLLQINIEWAAYVGKRRKPGL